MPFDMLTCRLDHEEDADIIEFLKQAVAQGYSKSYIVKQAIRYYAGLLAKVGSENIDQAFVRVIQFEKRLAELEKRDEERYQRILELIQREIEESRKERAEIRKEIGLIKRSLEQQKAR